VAEGAGGEDRSGEDLTEEASPYRIEEMRKKGHVAQSKELAGLVALLAAGVAAYVMAPMLGGQLAEFMRDVFRTDLSARADLGGTHVLSDTMIRALRITALVGLPVSLAGFVLGVVGSWAQIGNIFTLEPLTPDFSKIDPIAGLQRLFSFKHLIDGVRLTFKAVVVVAVAYALVKGEVLTAGTHALQDPASLFAAYGHAAKGIFLGLIAVLGLFAAIDFGVQRWEYSKQTRMTKQEAKQEFKEREGDPAIKARIRAVQREAARKRMMQAVKKADVIITNPTHIAIALTYDREKMAAPKVVAKGADFLAQRIKKVAAEAGVPLVENVPLARTLYKTVKVGHSVPRALYQAVAEVLAYVYRLKGRGF
jgi:flagellar biosynthetic protein FlhB